MTKKIVLAVSGASGSVYAVELARQILAANAELYITLTKPAQQILKSELNFSNFKDALGDCPNIENLREFKDDDFFAPIASGSFGFDAMVVAPCSANTIGKLAYGVADNLLCRAAAVALKEKRKLVLLLRETPLSLPLLKSCATLAQAGAVIMPACPAFYSNEQTFADLINFTVGKTLAAIDIPQNLVKEWQGK